MLFMTLIFLFVAAVVVVAVVVYRSALPVNCFVDGRP